MKQTVIRNVGDSYMTIQTKLLSENTIKITPEGRIDAETSPELRSVIAAIDPGVTKVLMDFKDVVYISSAGLRELLICRKKYPGDSMLVENVNPGVYEIFATTGFDSVIPVKVLSREESGPAHTAAPESMSFAAFLESRAHDDPDRIAVITENDRYSWSDIEKGASIIAHDLAGLGVTKGAHVVLCGLNSVNWIMAFFAIQKLGAMALLINSSQVAADIGATAAVGDALYIVYGELIEMKDEQEFIRGISAESGCDKRHFYCIRNHIDLRKRFPEYDTLPELPARVSEADDASVMIFTSGSTGRPKGVLLSAYNVLNAAYSSSADQTLNADDKICLILPLFHIFGLVAGLFANAVAGSAICIPRDIRTDTLIDMIYRERCTIFHSVPTLLLALMNNKSFSPDKMESLRCTIISGAAATEAQIRQFEKALPHDVFLSSYGLSEMAPVSITPYGDSDEHVLHTVGKPVDNINIMISDLRTHEACKTGVEGEILVQGYNLMSGYYKASIDDQSIDGEGWLHTGDLGYMTEDGYLCLSGRLKELIIRGGENIMPIQIERAISELDIIADVSVFGVPSEFFGEEIGACIRLKPGARFDESEIRSELSGRISRFRIPSYFEVYDEFPLLGSGKTDKVKLKNDLLGRINARNP